MLEIVAIERVAGVEGEEWLPVRMRDVQADLADGAEVCIFQLQERVGLQQVKLEIDFEFRHVLTGASGEAVFPRNAKALGIEQGLGIVGNRESSSGFN